MAEEQVRAIEALLSRRPQVRLFAFICTTEKKKTNPWTPDVTAADTSTTTIDTVPDNQDKDGYLNLMLRHTHTAAIPEPNDRKKLFGWKRRMQCKVVHHSFPLILKVKPCLDCTLQEENFQARASDALAEAETELYEYLQTCFKRNACADPAIAMSAASPYWHWIKVKREQIVYGIVAAITQVEAMLKRFSNAPIFTLGTKQSDDELTRLRDKGLIPILEKHHWYKSTMVPNPQR